MRDVRSLSQTEVAIASILAAGLWALQTRSWRRLELHMPRIGGTTVAGRGHDSVDFGCRSLGSANPFLAPGGVAHEDRQVQIDKPSIAYWRDHSAGATGGYGTNFLTPPSGTRMGGGAGAFSALWRSR